MKTRDEAARLRKELRERGAVRGKRFEPELRPRGRDEGGYPERPSGRPATHVQ